MCRVMRRFGSCFVGCRTFRSTSLTGGELPRPVRRGSEVFRTIANVNPSIGRATVRDRPNMRRRLPLSCRRPRVVSLARRGRRRRGRIGCQGHWRIPTVGTFDTSPGRHGDDQLATQNRHSTDSGTPESLSDGWYNPERFVPHWPICVHPSLIRVKILFAGQSLSITDTAIFAPMRSEPGHDE
jgi:hypothetical protein